MNPELQPTSDPVVPQTPIAAPIPQTTVVQSTETTVPKKKNNILLILLLILIIALLAGVGTLLALNYMQNQNAQNQQNQAQDQNDNDTEVEEDDNSELDEEDPIIEECDTEVYTTEDYPEFSITYDCNWELEDNISVDENDIFADGVDYNAHEITLTTENSELTFTIDEIIWEGYPTCDEGEYEKLSNGFARLYEGPLMGNERYFYVGSLEEEGSTEFNTSVEIWGEPDVDYDYCAMISIPFGTKSSEVSQSEAGIPMGQNFHMTVLVDLTVDNSDDLEEILEMADEIVMNTEF